MLTGTATRSRPLAISDVTIADAFWSPRREIIHTSTLPQQERQLRSPGQQFDALRLAWRPGDPHEPHIFWESDIAKWIEAASYVLAGEHDPQLEASVDEAIELLAGAQEEDGYLNTYFTVVRPGERFTDLQDAHELYCAGHLIEAGVAHYEATGKIALLNVVRRYADLIDREFGPGGSAEGGYDGHQEVELALVKLYNATNEDRYLRLAERLIDNRGTQPFYFEAERVRRGTPGYFDFLFEDRARRADWYRQYNQSHLPVREQTEVVGHSVRAMYMYSAMADLASHNDDAALRSACERLWNDLVDSKLYITGGIGALHSIEGFGPAYHLPDADAYAETCAAIGLVFWAQRMALLTGEAKYVDVLERALYNGVLSGSSEDGTCYFYGNPLASDGDVQRSEWFGVACCPPNFARLLASLEHYVYAVDDRGLTVNLYVAGAATFEHNGQDLTLTQQTRYPWGGRIDMNVETSADTEATIRLRIPQWATNWTAAVNGSQVVRETQRGYAVLDRTWSSGDTITLELSMEPTRVWADARVAAARGKVAIQRGPIVHCIEETDNAAPVSALALSREAQLRVMHDHARGLDSITAGGTLESRMTDVLYTSREPETSAIDVRTTPYFSWANRERGSMTVWMRESAT
ncbi:glycoside hydrolase family 127 protein [Microbacterium aurantiacum]|uniref:glycoside hydrolase family 127 protein n=1 Tax=Microbacterium aurantiacum TaxID=162393 RepID=UPI000C80AA75|nr:beta-L-arabinofuranosidase domain-containing protein [Microbacterium aurantiacum]